MCYFLFSMGGYGRDEVSGAERAGCRAIHARSPGLLLVTGMPGLRTLQLGYVPGTAFDDFGDIVLYKYIIWEGRELAGVSA